MFKRYPTLALVLGLFAFLVVPVFGQTDNASIDSVWRTFRTTYPYHIQGIALTEPDSSGTRILVIAEPPPHITLDGLQALNPNLLQRPNVKRCRVGYDGWVADIIYILPQMTPSELHGLLDRLNHYLYGTSYKATVIPLSAHAKTAAARNLDLRIPAGEIGEWVLGDLARANPGRSGGNIVGLFLLALVALWALVKLLGRSRNRRHVLWLVLSSGALLVVWFAGRPSGDDKMLSFDSVLGGEKYTGREILENHRSGVFLSEKPGVVLWSFPRTSPLNAARIHAREFALDSDVLIGAVATANQVVILGRERCLPLEVVPPLRAETIFQLASVRSDELAQSYERRDLLAGKFDGEHDWAPIYLSPNLIDTEYGSLLNITDQILKSWSMHGTVRYVNFHYPDPQQFPFPTDLMSYAKTDEVTFNWNTKGVGYTTRNNLYEVYALNRTGALPVDYLSADNSELQKAEEQGYSYFAALNDANLVRVVQYAALYQIFRRFGVTAGDSRNGPSEPAPVPEALRDPIRQMLIAVAILTDEKLDHFRARAHAAGKDSPRFLQSLEDLRTMRDDIQEMTDDPQALDQLVDALAAPRDAMKRIDAQPEAQRTDTDKEIAEMIELAERTAGALQKISGADLAQTKDAYVSEVERTTPTWIRTPTIVISEVQVENHPGLVGGHNLDAKITQFRFDPNLHAGELRVSNEGGETVISHSAADADKVPELVRVAARNEEKSPEEVAQILQGKLSEVQVPERPIETALGFTEEARPAAGRGFQPEAADANVGTLGWKPTLVDVPERSKNLMKALDSGKGPSVIVSRQSDGSYLVAHGKSQHVLVSTDLPSAVDAALSCIQDEDQNGAEMHLYLAGFEPGQGKGFARSVEFNLSDNEFSRISATIETEPIDPGELAQILAKDYKTEQATLTKVAIVDEKHVDVELQVPAKEAAKPSLFVRLRLFFEEGFTITKAFLDSVQTIVTSWRLALETAPERVDLFLAHKMLIRDLRKVHPEITDVDIIYSREKKDLFHGARNQDPPSDGRNSRQPV